MILNLDFKKYPYHDNSLKIYHLISAPDIHTGPTLVITDLIVG